MRTGSRHAPGGVHAGFPFVLSTAGLAPTGRTGVRVPADGDPCRIRTCVRCVRGSRPTAGRTGRELERKVEVSNPHGRAVYLFSKQGAPANEAYLPGRRGSGSNAGEVALGHRLASEHLSSRRTLQCTTSAVSHLPTAPPARFERASSGVGDRCASSCATGAVGPESVQSHHPEPTRGPQPYQGCALPTELWRRGLVDWTRTSGLCLRRAALLSI